MVRPVGRELARRPAAGAGAELTRQWNDFKAELLPPERGEAAAGQRTDAALPVGRQERKLP